jgi:hypothetical protein
VGSLLGRRILGGLNTTLTRTLNGGAGISGDGTITITGRDGVARNVVIDTNSSVQGVLDALNAAAPAAFSAKLNKNGTGIIITDTTNGTGNLIIDGSSAASLGLATVPAGVASATVDSGSLQHQYVTAGTLLSSLRAGQGVGTGKFRITDSLGTTALVTIDENTKSLDDVIRNINGRGTRIKARINTKGDGLELYEEATGGRLGQDQSRRRERRRRRQPEYRGRGLRDWYIQLHRWDSREEGDVPRIGHAPAGGHQDHRGGRRHQRRRHQRWQWQHPLPPEPHRQEHRHRRSHDRRYGLV